MDGVANVARQQQSQIPIQDTQGIESSRLSTKIEQPKQVDLVKKSQEENSSTSVKINSKEQVEELVSQLNDAMSPISTDIRFGVDRDDIFFVSVIEEKTSKMIRRFPAEQAMDFLSKMQEITGILFDSKG